MQNPADQCVYAKGTNEGKVIIIIRVDYLIMASSDEKVLKKVKKTLVEKFKIKNNVNSGIFWV